MKKLSVIIVSYKVRYYLEQCIVSVERATKDIDREILVVDNHSGDGTVEYLRTRFADRITLIESSHNLGFSRANNIAIRQSESEYVLLLNPDTFVSETSISEVLGFMDTHPKAGGAGVMMHNADGSVALESRRGLPTPWVSLQKMLGVSKRYYMSQLPWDKPGQIEVVSGAFFMLRRKAIDKVGMLDEDFFMYGEDIDLSYRILKGGYENWYIPAKIVHYKGESTVKSSFRYVHVFYQAMLIFFRKHYSHLSWVVSIPIKSAIYARALIALLQMQYNRLRHSLGFVDKYASSPDYVFIGSDEMVEKCKALSRRKGLPATFASPGFTPEPNPHSCVVYDTSVYSYEQIIQAAESDQKSSIGTYNTVSQVLITPNEIIQ